MLSDILQPVIAGMIAVIVPHSVSIAHHLLQQRIDPLRILVTIAEKDIRFSPLIGDCST